MLNSLIIFESVLSLANVVSLLIIVFFLEKNLRMNWILKDELNAFSVLLFISLAGLLLKEILFLWTIIASFFIGMNKSYDIITHTTPWFIINFIFSIALIGTAIIIIFGNNKVSIISRNGRIWFKVNKK